MKRAHTEELCAKALVAARTTMRVVNCMLKVIEVFVIGSVSVKCWMRQLNTKWDSSRLD